MSGRELARQAVLRPIEEVARELGLTRSDLWLYGPHMAKVLLNVLDRPPTGPRAKLVDVTAITPTPLGEGKTVTTIGLVDGLRLQGARAIACLRQPSLGVTFGLKGGGSGGGRAQVAPGDAINLHFTGDTHAVGAAQNLLAAATDAHLFHGNSEGLESHSIAVNRVVDVDDRSLRNLVIGLGERADGVPRQAGFDLTAASEMMAILAMAADADDLRKRVGRIVVGRTRDGRLVTAEQIGVAGALALLLRDALMPNLVQTLEGSPALVHAGPFGNLSLGNSSIVADRVALALGDYVVTESGFGADLGMEKFMNLKCRAAGSAPDCVVLVATVRALKVHGGAARVIVGKPLPAELDSEDLVSLERGSANLVKHVANARAFGIPVVVAVNVFPTDTQAEIALVQRVALASGATGAVVCTAFQDGGVGATELAQAVIAACRAPGAFAMTYQIDDPVADKIEKVARGVFGADGVDYSARAAADLKRITRGDNANLPICMAKTHLSLSHDPKLLGAPTGFRLPVQRVNSWAGAGFLQVFCGDIRTMPGLPSRPAFLSVDVADGQAVGLT